MVRAVVVRVAAPAVVLLTMVREGAVMVEMGGGMVVPASHPHREIKLSAFRQIWKRPGRLSPVL
jgi:hypothetical protein